MVGRTILQYEFLEKLGEGGMGEIYRARDTRLNRLVAIKLLPPGKAADPERRRRFVHEAQAASALNHPNIIVIHDIVSDNGYDFIVMEFVAGKTLAELIPASGFPISEILSYARQIAAAFEAAHSARIIHRDLKPGNVMVTETGHVKLLDFGLAKLNQHLPDSILETDETVAIRPPLTVEGAILGTVSYMSPEQAEGKPIDARSDIFAFGVLLYEITTGRRAFEGDSGLSTLSAILRDEAPPIVQFTSIPPALEHLISRCMRKKPAERYQSMSEVLAALAAIQPAPRPKPSPLPRIAAAIAILAAASVGAWWFVSRPKPAAPAPTAAQSSPPAPETSLATPASDTLTNAHIIEMVDAKVAHSVILSQIRSSKTNFDLSTDQVIRLSKAGVPPSIIEAMRDPKAVPVTAPSPSSSPASTPTPSSIPAPSAPPPPSAPAAVPDTRVSVPDSLPIRIILAEDVPADAPEGRVLRFTTIEPLVVDGKIVVAKGAAVTGNIFEPARRRLIVVGGKLSFALDSVEAIGGQKLKVRATARAREEGPSRRPIETPSGSRVKGIAASQGSHYVAYVDGPQTLTIP